MEKARIKGGAVQGGLKKAVRLPCAYCNDGTLGIGFSSRCPKHYYQPALTGARKAV